MGRIPLGRIGGTPVYVNMMLWLVFVATTSACFFAEAVRGHPVGGLVGAGAVLGLFASLYALVLLHELGHATMARIMGREAENITLHIFGGIATINDLDEDNYVEELLVTAAGPFVDLAMFTPIFLLSRWWHAFDWPLYINVTMLAVNLIPVFPLDGGRLFRAVTHMLTGSLRGASLASHTLGCVLTPLIAAVCVWRGYSLVAALAAFFFWVNWVRGWSMWFGDD